MPVVHLIGNTQLPADQWQPHIGPEAIGLLAPLELSAEAKTLIREEAARILGRCIPPTQAQGCRTGLVVGYVQSGKTVSFTTVAALARDNKYRMVIIIAGTSTLLTTQSRSRLVKDLRVETRIGQCPWQHVPGPTPKNHSSQLIRDTLAEWNDATVPPDELRTVLITVMKHHGHLGKLIQVLKSVDMTTVPTLIIDDEGDQAGLNTEINKGTQSTTYRRLLELKAAIPHHSFLQYTATPQAPVLINIIDVLSPSFAEIITPGSAYLGGKDFFAPASTMVKLIPPGDIPSQTNTLLEPPPSLHKAMRLFFLGVAAHLVQRPEKPKHRSMMVHPSRLQDEHDQSFDWVDRARQVWMDILQHEGEAADELMREFEVDYADLQATVNDIPPFAALRPRIRHAIQRTTVKLLNRSPRGGNVVNWGEGAYWILVGGQLMDRGFTVEGITVTYMPRGPGQGQADTIQQRARFFGYHRQYMGYCRVFLEQSVRDAFKAYVEHEEDIRNSLLSHSETGKPLIEWKRQFFLDRTLRPTRDKVIDVGYQYARFGNTWEYPEGPQDSEEAIVANRTIVADFLNRLELLPHDGLDNRTGDKNLIAKDVSLRMVHEELLTKVSVRRLEDSQLMAAILRLVQVHLINHPDDNCTIFLMAGGKRQRRGYENDKIKELFQGRQYAQNQLTYPGDREVRGSAGISVQLRYLDLGEPNALVAENVPHLAMWIPNDIARDVLQQPQGG